MKPTPEEWKEIEEKLASVYSGVELLVDGYELYLTLSKISKMRLAIVVYVNGWLKAEYWRDDCEERRRFYSRSKRHVYTKRFRDAMSKLEKKLSRSRILKAANLKPDVDIYRTVDVFTPYWTSFSRLKAHLIKNNESIEWTNRPSKKGPLIAAAEESHVR
jgi:hypothetical protein